MKEFMKKILMWSLAFIAIASVFVLAGEPNESVSVSLILIPKAIAMVVLIGCILFGRYAQKKGLLPKGEKLFIED